MEVRQAPRHAEARGRRRQYVIPEPELEPLRESVCWELLAHAQSLLVPRGS